MQIHEVISPLKKFLAVIRVKNTQAKTVIEAETQTQARLLLSKMYESPRILRRLQTLRRWSHEQEIKSFFTRGA